MKTRIADEMADAPPWEQPTLRKRALRLDGTQEIAPTQVDTDQYTAFMGSLQQSAATTPIVRTKVFTVPEIFRDTLLSAIKRLKQKRAPGSDMIRPETFRAEPHSFGDAALALWRAVGHVAKMPHLLISRLLFPIYKRK